MARERRARKKAEIQSEVDRRVKEPWEHVDFYTSQLNNAGTPGGTKVFARLTLRSDFCDGLVHKTTGGQQLVVYVHAHGISYTLEDINAGALNFPRFKKIERGRKDKALLLILDSTTGKTLPKPVEGATHPLHVFLSKPHAYDPTGKLRLNKKEKFTFVRGNGVNVNLVPGSSYPEYEIAMAEAVAGAR